MGASLPPATVAVVVVVVASTSFNLVRRQGSIVEVAFQSLILPITKVELSSKTSVSSETPQHLYDVGI